MAEDPVGALICPSKNRHLSTRERCIRQNADGFPAGEYRALDQVPVRVSLMPLLRSDLALQQGFSDTDCAVAPLEVAEIYIKPLTPCFFYDPLLKII